MATLTALWEETESCHPDKVGVIAGEVRLTYRQLGDRIRTLAWDLVSRKKIQPGDVVALLAPNCAEFIIAYFAITRIGAIVQPLDERLTSEEIKTLLDHAGARLLIVHRQLWSKLEQLHSKPASVRQFIGIDFTAPGVEPFPMQGGESIPAAPVAPGMIAELMYTSGTTGEPKGVLRTHANVCAAIRNSIRGFGYCHSDTIAIVMPLSHSSALNSQMLPLIQLGGTLVLLNRFDVPCLLDAIKREQVTCMRAVPTMMRMLLAAPEFCHESLPSLRLLINSSGPIDGQTFASIKERFASIRVMNSYGLTEASTCTVLGNEPDAEATLARLDSIGRPIEGVEMAIMDSSGQPLADTLEGEICVRGDHVFAGYYKQPAITESTFVNGWLRTRDLGHRDADGFYYLHGRTDDVINTGGHKYAPLEVEQCILQLPDVAEVAVVAAPHAILGQVGKAFVVPRAQTGLDSKQVRQHCTRLLPSYKIPFFVEIVAELPKNSVGKTLRHKLKE